MTSTAIDKLPCEVLGIVFEFCVPRHPFKALPRRHTITSPKHAPLLLTQVCSAWRTLVINTASLWTEFVLQELSLSEIPKELCHPIRLLSLYITRSQDFPFSFHLVDIAPKRQSGDGAFVEEIWALLAPIAHQIQALNIGCFLFTNGFSLRGMKALRSLQVGLFERSWTSADWTTGQHTPELRAIALTDFDSGVTLGWMPLPWYQLRFLQIDTPYGQPQNLLLVLKECTALASCCLSFERENESDPHHESFHKAKLPNLTKLKLVSGGSEFSILNGVKCPNLSELDLEAYPITSTKIWHGASMCATWIL